MKLILISILSLFVFSASAQSCGIVGPSSFEAGTQNEYRTLASTGATYQWSVTGGLAIIGSSTSFKVTLGGLHEGSVSGICVTRTEADGSSCYQCMDITVTPVSGDLSETSSPNTETGIIEGACTE